MLHISKNKCVGCGICRDICPEGLEISNGMARLTNKNIDCLKNIVSVCPQKAIKEIGEKIVFAIGTDDNKTIKPDDHVGMSKYFQVWEYSDGDLTFKEKRENVKYGEDKGRIHGDPNKAKATTSALTNIDILVGKMFGPNISRLKNKFVCVVIREPKIQKAKKIIKENINEIIEEHGKGDKQGIILN